MACAKPWSSCHRTHRSQHCGTRAAFWAMPSTKSAAPRSPAHWCVSATIALPWQGTFVERSGLGSDKACSARSCTPHGSPCNWGIRMPGIATNFAARRPTTADEALMLDTRAALSVCPRAHSSFSPARPGASAEHPEMVHTSENMWVSQFWCQKRGCGS